MDSIIQLFSGCLFHTKFTYQHHSNHNTLIRFDPCGQKAQNSDQSTAWLLCAWSDQDTTGTQSKTWYWQYCQHSKIMWITNNEICQPLMIQLPRYAINGIKALTEEPGDGLGTSLHHGRCNTYLTYSDVSYSTSAMFKMVHKIGNPLTLSTYIHTNQFGSLITSVPCDLDNSRPKRLCGS